MFKAYQPAHDIPKLVEKILPKFSGYLTAALVPLKAELSTPQGDLLIQNVYFLFVRPEDFTMVLFCNYGGRFFKFSESEDWYIKSNSESDWDTEGIQKTFDTLGIEMAKRLHITCELGRLKYLVTLLPKPAVGIYRLKEFNEIVDGEIFRVTLSETR